MRSKSKGLRGEMSDLKEALAETVFENRILKKSMIADGDVQEPHQALNMHPPVPETQLQSGS